MIDYEISQRYPKTSQLSKESGFQMQYKYKKKCYCCKSLDQWYFKVNVGIYFDPCFQQQCTKCPVLYNEKYCSIPCNFLLAVRQLAAASLQCFNASCCYRPVTCLLPWINMPIQKKAYSFHFNCSWRCHSRHCHHDTPAPGHRVVSPRITFLFRIRQHNHDDVAFCSCRRFALV